MIEYYRIRVRLFYWTFCVVLSISCSRFYIDLFVPVTPRAVLLATSCIAIWLVISFLRLKRPIFLIVEYALLGALSAVSATGFAMLLISSLILFIAKFNIDTTSIAKWMSGFGHGRGYGYGGNYGSYGGYGGYGSSGNSYGYYGYADGLEDSETGKVDKTAQRALLAERLRLSLILFYCLGFIAMLALLFVCGVACGAGVKELLLEWLGNLWLEVKCTLASSDMLAVLCAVTISVVFVRYRFYRMLNDEYYILTKDVIRLVFAALVAAVGLLGIGLKLVLRGDVSTRGLVFVPLSLQIVAGLVLLRSIIVFLVNMKCRKCMVGDEEFEGDNTARQFNWMAIPFLMFLDVCPVIFVAFSTSDIWRKYL